jgi:hypothetical protein
VHSVWKGVKENHPFLYIHNLPVENFLGVTDTFYFGCFHGKLTSFDWSCMQAEVTFRSAPRSAGGSRWKWTRRWRGRRPPARRWLRGRPPPRTWSRRRDPQRLGPGPSSPANKEKESSPNQSSRAVRPTRTKDRIPSYQLPLNYSYYMGLCFLFKPLLRFRWLVSACLMSLMMMYRETEGEERVLVFRTAAFQVSTLPCSCMEGVLV